MHIQLETPEQNTIRSYTDASITIGETVYQDSVILSKDTLLCPWSIESLNTLDEERLAPLLSLNPDLIIIGHNTPLARIPGAMMAYLSKRQIGIESMSLGAASRTFNVLLSEDRHVVAGIIFAKT